MSSVCQIYVTQKYGRCAIILDGYKDEPSTKDATHLRRTGACTGVTINFTGGMIVQSKKEEFLLLLLLLLQVKHQLHYIEDSGAVRILQYSPEYN